MTTKAEAQAIQANLRRQLVEAETAANLDRLAVIRREAFSLFVDSESK